MDASNRVRAIVVTGSEKAFAAGADVKEMAPKGFVDMFVEDYFTGPTETIMRCRKPVIAAVAGYCLGGGCELAMTCDFIIAADTAKFGQPEINLGVIPGLGGTQRLTRFVGKSKAMEMCLTGRFMDAAEAERSGLVSRVVPAKDLLREAHDTAVKIAEKSPLAVRADQGGGEPQLRDHAARGPAVRAPAVPRALRHRGPGRGHGRLHREAQPAVPRQVAASGQRDPRMQRHRQRGGGRASPSPRTTGATPAAAPAPAPAPARRSRAAAPPAPASASSR